MENMSFNNHTVEKPKEKIFIEKPLDGETAEQYISRFFIALTEKYNSNNPEAKRINLDKKNPDSARNYKDKAFDEFLADETARKEFLENIQRILENENVRQSKEEDEKQLLRLDKKIGKATNSSAELDMRGKEKIDNTDYYDKTNVERNFFTSRGKGDDSYAYISMISGLPKGFAETPEGQSFVHSMVDGKNIFLFGGGDSIKDLLRSEEYQPASVVNFDPYLKSETADKNPRGIYQSEGISAVDPKISEKVRDGELKEADEIWATYSVPFYLNTGKEIEGLINNIGAVLAEGGNAYISPIAVQDTEKDSENFYTRKKALLDAIEKLTQRDDINLSVFNNSIKIHRIKKPEASHSSQESTEKEKNKDEEVAKLREIIMGKFPDKENPSF